MAELPEYNTFEALEQEVKEDLKKHITVERNLTGHREIDAFLEECLETMRVKGHDYRQGNDADLLHNFRTVAEAVGTDMEKVWFTYFYKHFSAMVTFIKEGGQSESEPIEGRIKDQIVYLLLFHQMVQERKRAKVSRLGEIYKQAEAADRNYQRLKERKEENEKEIRKIARKDALHANGMKSLDEIVADLTKTASQKDEGTGGGAA